MIGKESARAEFGLRIIMANGPNAHSVAVLACILLLALPLSGCGGGGGGSTTTQPPATTQPPPAAPPPVEPPPEAPPPAEPPPAEPPPEQPPPPPSEPTPPEEPTPPPPPVEPPPEEPPPPPPPPAAYNLTLTGWVLHAPVPFADVTARVGSQVFHAKADAEGQYSISIASDDGAALVELSATSTQQPLVDYVSLVGSMERLVVQAGADGILTANENHDVNVTNVSTARYVMLREALGRSVVNQQDLDMASTAVPGLLMIELAAIVRLVVDYGAPLPGNITGIRELISTQSAIDAFKVVSVSSGQLEEAVEALLDPQQSPGLLPSFDSEISTEGYVLTTPRPVGTITGGGFVLLFNSNGTGEYLRDDFTRFTQSFTFSWGRNIQTGTLIIVPDEDVLYSLFNYGNSDSDCAPAAQLEQWLVREEWLLVHKSPFASEVISRRDWRRTYAGDPPGCPDLPPEIAEASSRSGTLISPLAQTVASFAASDFPTTMLLRDTGLDSDFTSTPGAAAASLFVFDAGGTSQRIRWTPGEPLGSDSSSTFWLLHEGKLTVQVSPSERYTYYRVRSDSEGGELLAYIIDRDGTRSGGTMVTSHLDGSTMITSDSDYFGEWKSGFRLADFPTKANSYGSDFTSFRLCSDETPTAENTGDLFGTGYQRSVSTLFVDGNYEQSEGTRIPISWGALASNGEMVARRYYDRTERQIVSFCEVSDPPEAGDCGLMQERYWLPISQSGNRLYVLETFTLDSSVLTGSADPEGQLLFKTMRPAFYEKQMCLPLP